MPELPNCDILATMQCFCHLRRLNGQSASKFIDKLDRANSVFGQFVDTYYPQNVLLYLEPRT